MSMLKEFREFAVRGNVVDMAVGVIIGTAFGKIVTSLVADIVMPPIGVLLGGVDFSDLSVTVRRGTEEIPPVLVNYGVFLQTVIDFIIIAIAVFMMLKVINRLKRKQVEKAADVPPAAPTLPST
mgnify:FL=1